MDDTSRKERIWILVKAFPQPSRHYEETVCCAGITESDHRLIRLYPIRYRHLEQSQQFGRFDCIEATICRAPNDTRPESYRVIENTLRIIQPASKNAASRARLWMPLVETSLEDLEFKNRERRTSLGIVRPDPKSLRLNWKPAEEESAEIQQQTKAFQASLLDAPLPPLTKEYVFRYKFTAGSKKRECQILDWEVQATYFNYCRKYGNQALEYMKREYQDTFALQSPHFIMGNTAAHQANFSIVGVLRTSEYLPALAAQEQLPF